MHPCTLSEDGLSNPVAEVGAFLSDALQQADIVILDHPVANLMVMAGCWIMDGGALSLGGVVPFCLDDTLDMENGSSTSGTYCEILWETWDIFFEWQIFYSCSAFDRYRILRNCLFFFGWGFICFFF